MGAPANFVWLPLLLLALITPTAPLVIAQNTATESSSSKIESSSPSSPPSSTTVSPSSSTASTNAIVNDLTKAARVEQIDREQADQPIQKGTDGGPYDVIDVLAATSAGGGQPKSGQTTRIYTTGEVNDDFWLKHLGDDFKHAIHLQVGDTNADYNRIINQTSNGVHEEVHHEYLPGAERPSDVRQHEHQHHHYQQQQQEQEQQEQEQQQQQEQQPQLGHDAGYDQTNLNNQLNYGGDALSHGTMEQQYAQGYGQLHSAHYNNNRQLYNTDRQTYPHIQHNTYNTHNTHNTHDTHIHTRTHDIQSRHELRHRYKPNNIDEPPAESSIINSSEDTLHAVQTQTAAATPGSSSSLDGSGQLPFKSPFNDYGNRQ